MKFNKKQLFILIIKIVIAILIPVAIFFAFFLIPVHNRTTTMFFVVFLIMVCADIFYIEMAHMDKNIDAIKKDENIDVPKMNNDINASKFSRSLIDEVIEIYLSLLEKHQEQISFKIVIYLEEKEISREMILKCGKNDDDVIAGILKLFKRFEGEMIDYGLFFDDEPA